MAGQQGSKGNPASRRMMNPKLKEKRARSWARGQKRKAANKAAADAKMRDNLNLLKELGVVRINYERRLKSGKTVMKLESPSQALRRHYRSLVQ